MNRIDSVDFICEQLVNIVHGEVTRISRTGKIIKTYGIEKQQNSISVCEKKYALEKERNFRKL